MVVMGLGRTVIGAIVGALVGIGLHMALGAVIHQEAMWFVMIIGALTGLGVRKADKPHPGEVHYANGALSALVALIAMFASLALVPIVVAKTTPPPKDFEKTASKPASERPSAEGTTQQPVGEQTGEVPSENPFREEIHVSGRLEAEQPVTIWQFFDAWQSLFVAIGALIAYECGRGIGKAPAKPAGGAA